MFASFTGDLLAGWCHLASFLDRLPCQLTLATVHANLPFTFIVASLVMKRKCSKSTPLSMFKIAIVEITIGVRKDTGTMSFISVILPHKLPSVLPIVGSLSLSQILFIISLMEIPNVHKQAPSMSLSVSKFPKALVDSIPIVVDHATHSMRFLTGHVQNASVSAWIVLAIHHTQIDNRLAGRLAQKFRTGSLIVAAATKIGIDWSCSASLLTRLRNI
mmetsp:Transcript_36484/g.88415  ORF Transcript_36484/g.88415 Transcript_36484/m.88415 type:complete len:217 (-) Transcript_36484:1714-2364(-)